IVAPNPLAARRRTNSSSCSVAVPSSWEASVVSGAMPNRFAFSCPLLKRKGDQTTIDQNLLLSRLGELTYKYDPCLDGHPPIQILDVVVDQSDTSGSDEMTDGFRRVRAMDQQTRFVQQQRAGPQQTARVTG